MLAHNLDKVYFSDNDSYKKTFLIRCKLKNEKNYIFVNSFSYHCHILMIKLLYIKFLVGLLNVIVAKFDTCKK